MSNKKVGFLLEYFPPNTLSSALLPFAIVEELLNKNFNVTVITGYEINNDFDDEFKRTHQNKIKIIRLKYYRSKKNRFIKSISMIVFFLKSLFKIKHFKNLDVIFVYSNPPINYLLGYIIKKIYGIKIIFVVFDFYPDIALFTGQISKESLLYRFFEVINSKVFDGTNSIVVISNDMKDYICSKFPKSKQSVKVISNWFQTKFNFSIKKYTSTFINIGFFGNLGITQDIDSIKRLLLHFQYNNNVKFNFSIHGNYFYELNQFISQYNLSNVNVLRYLPETEYLTLLSKQDYVILSLNKDIYKVASPSRLYSFLKIGIPIIFMDHSESCLSKEIETYKLGQFINLKSQNLTNEFNKIIPNLKNYNRLDIVNHFKKYYQPKLNIKKYIDLIKD